MANYHVIKNSNVNKWEAKRERATRISGFYKTQAEAEKAAKQFAAHNGGGEVRIHSIKGSIRDSDTVKPAVDLFPPKDDVH